MLSVMHFDCPRKLRGGGVCFALGMCPRHIRFPSIFFSSSFLQCLIIFLSLHCLSFKKCFKYFFSFGLLIETRDLVI